MSRKTVYVAAGAVLVILGIYFLGNQRNGNFIDLEEGQKHVCHIDDSQQLLLIYHKIRRRSFMFITIPARSFVLTAVIL